MKAWILPILVGSLIALLSCNVLANDIICPDNINVDPGQWILLDGYAPATYPDNTNVEYTWTFAEVGGSGYTIYDNANAVITQPGKDRYFGFNAPMEPGCYKAYLTVTYSYFVYDNAAAKLDATCTDMTCLGICVKEFQCPQCSYAFCETTPPTYPGTTCPVYLKYPGTLSEVLVVEWYIDSVLQTDDDAVKGDIGINWGSSAFTTQVHTIEMVIKGPPSMQEKFRCTVGKVSKVEQPEAKITPV